MIGRIFARGIGMRIRTILLTTFLVLASLSSVAQDTLINLLPAGFFRSFILYPDSTFRFETRLQLGEGYHRGTYSRIGSDVHFYFDRMFRDDTVKQSKSGDPDSMYFTTNSREEIWLNVKGERYHGFKQVVIPATKDTVLYQVGENALWLVDHKKGNRYDIIVNTPHGRSASTNMYYAVLHEYYPGKYKIKIYNIVFAGMERQIAHRMGDGEFILKNPPEEK
jgi:hypothetical protein